jgi:hypothetical protein
MQRGLAILACAALILLGTVADIVAGPRKVGRATQAMASPIQCPFPRYVDISGVFLRY